MIYLGIDPGMSGAIAAVAAGGSVIGNVRLSETKADVAEWLAMLISQETITGVVAVLEKVNAMPKQGVSSTFKFGASFGFCEGILTVLEIPYELVSPVKWQTAMGCRTGGDKNVSKAAAQRLWPAAKFTHANADATLIAEYCRRLHAVRNGQPMNQ